jgi:hypothetical protein
VWKLPELIDKSLLFIVDKKWHLQKVYYTLLHLAAREGNLTWEFYSKAAAKLCDNLCNQISIIAFVMLDAFPPW